MRLFTREEAKSGKQQADARFRAENEKAQKTLIALLERINEKNGEYQMLEEKRRKELSILDEEIQRKTTGLRNDITLLEQQRKEVISSFQDEFRNLANFRQDIVSLVDAMRQENIVTHVIHEQREKGENAYLEEKTNILEEIVTETHDLLVTRKEAQDIQEQSQTTRERLLATEKHLEKKDAERKKQQTTFEQLYAETCAQLRFIKDERERLKYERDETEKQKQELATIIAILKKKGLWQQANEMITMSL